MTTTTESTQPDAVREVPPFAVLGVGAIALVAAVGLFAVLGQYGFFGDELYFLAAGGHHLAVSYADQGPLLPLIARLMDSIAPGSLVALRLPALLITVAGIVLAAAIAREIGGGRGAQLISAVAYATSPFLFVQGSQLSTNAIDGPLWVLITWLLVRWVRTRADVLLIMAGVVTAIDMQVKWLIPFFWICVGISVLVYGPRDLLRRPALWIGAAITAVAMVPSLLWQAANGWPQLAMGGVVSAEQEMIGGRLIFVPVALLAAGLLGAILLVYGTIRLFRAESLRPYRFFGLVVVLLVVAFVATGGRPYYAVGIYPIAMAAGAVGLVEARATWQRIAAVPVIGLSVALAAWSLPWQPESSIPPSTGGADLLLHGKFGWSDLAASTDLAYRTLSPAERTHAVIVAESYWQAGALETYRQQYGWPAVYSPSRGYGYLGTPPDTASTVVYVGAQHEELRAHFGSVTPIGRADARLGYAGATRDVTIWRCELPVRPWSQLWTDLREM
ncbi:glycosyltransferase family 39 protein [Nocardia sp. NPDC057272]|uniref:glycosyltransferase family 39 protein n=1 Tax=Nocardia sp. NPDC057272 TaxID=3346079 RepID=UPI003636C75D